MLAYAPFAQIGLNPMVSQPLFGRLGQTSQPGVQVSPNLEVPAAVGIPLVLGGLLVAASVGVSAYHGYKRNNSIGWGLWWGLMGLTFPIVAPAVAIAEGYGKRER